MKGRFDLIRAVAWRAGFGVAVLGASLAVQAQAPTSASGAGATPKSSAARPPIPKAKLTTLGLYMTAAQAHQRWRADPKVKILDVRTPEEYLFVGYAPMAWRIPVARQTYEWDATKQQYPAQLLPDFVARVGTVAQPGPHGGGAGRSLACRRTSKARTRKMKQAKPSGGWPDHQTRATT